MTSRLISWVSIAMILSLSLSKHVDAFAADKSISEKTALGVDKTVIMTPTSLESSQASSGDTAQSFPALNNSPSAIPTEPVIAEKSLSLKPAYTLLVGTTYSKLSDGYGTFRANTVRGYMDTGKDVFFAEASAQNMFGENGTAVSMGQTHIIDEDWYAFYGIATGTNGFFLPRLRLDTSINRKWLEQRNLITTLGLGYIKQKDGHIDNSLLLSTTYYFNPYLIGSTGVTVNRSNPGSQISSRPYVAVTWGENKKRYVSAKADWGREAYQLIGPEEVISNFSSKSLRVTWREWLAPDRGIDLGAEWYKNPSYTKDTVEASLFFEF